MSGAGRGLPLGFWREFASEGPETEEVRLGPLRVFLRREGEDWLVAWDRTEMPEEMISPPDGFYKGPAPEGVGWRRLGGRKELAGLRLAPVLPARPVVVRPEKPFQVLPGERVQFYAGVPLGLSLRTAGGGLLWEEPVIRLSNTWFGTPMEGELCYAMRTRMRREREWEGFPPWRAVCPVRVRNLTKETIPFERLCIRAPHLSLYEEEDLGVWANETGVTIREEEKEWSRVAYARGAPAGLEGGRLLASPRVESRGGFSLRSLGRAGGWFT